MTYPADMPNFGPWDTLSFSGKNRRIWVIFPSSLPQRWRVQFGTGWPAAELVQYELTSHMYYPPLPPTHQLLIWRPPDDERTAIRVAPSDLRITAHIISLDELRETWMQRPTPPKRTEIPYARNAGAYSRHAWYGVWCCGTQGPYSTQERAEEIAREHHRTCPYHAISGRPLPDRRGWPDRPEGAGR